MRGYRRHDATRYRPGVTGAGVGYHANVLDEGPAKRLAEADRPGAHIWAMLAAWMVSDPQGWSTGSSGQVLDHENLVMLQGPGCLKCEQPWSRKLGAQPCRGTLDAPPE